MLSSVITDAVIQSAAKRTTRRKTTMELLAADAIVIVIGDKVAVCVLCYVFGLTEYRSKTNR